MSQTKSPEEEAAELLPCHHARDYGVTCENRGYPCSTCARRPAVAERLANYREQLRQRDEWIKAHESTIQALSDRGLQQSERIAALTTKIQNMEDLWGFELHDDGSTTAKALGRTLKSLGLKAAEQRITALEAERDTARHWFKAEREITNQLKAENERLRGAIAWALGEGDSDFKPRKEGQGRYWWRNKLAALAGRET